MTVMTTEINGNSAIRGPLLSGLDMYNCNLGFVGPSHIAAIWFQNSVKSAND